MKILLDIVFTYLLEKVSCGKTCFLSHNTSRAVSTPNRLMISKPTSSIANVGV